MKIGVLALQGDFREHIQTLQKLKAEAIEVKLPQHLTEIQGLIIPGGESTTMAKLMDLFELRTLLKERIEKGMPVWGTCAGMILLAKKLREDRPQPLGVMDIEVARNAFGRQIDSFEGDLEISVVGKDPVHIVFIRAPIITKVGKKAKILAKLPDGTIIAAQQDHMLGTSFHPELTEDLRFHEYFLELVKKAKIKP